MNIWDKSIAARDLIFSQTKTRPKAALVLGSGLGSLVNKLESKVKIPFSAIPHFKTTTVVGHKGNFVFGTLQGVEVVLVQGRLHFYEGFSMDEVTFYMRVLFQLGIKKVFVTNAVGGINTNYKVGNLVLINDHINAFPIHPLRGENDMRFGPRFLDLHQPYSEKHIEQLSTFAKNNAIPLQSGVYYGLQGPSFETKAEYKMIAILGGDVVGMSTVPEVIVANHMNIEVTAISVITDMGNTVSLEKIDHSKVLQAAKNAQEPLFLLFQNWLLTNH